MIDDEDDAEGFISLDMFNNKGHKQDEEVFTTTPDYGILEVKKELGVDIIQEIKKTFKDE